MKIDKTSEKNGGQQNKENMNNKKQAENDIEENVEKE